MKFFLLLPLVFLSCLSYSQITDCKSVNSNDYLNDLKNELQIKWSQNRCINLVFYGHSLPAGYITTPLVNTISAYHNLVLKKIKSIYPYAVVNVIVTAIGGENSVEGAERFERDVLIHKLDVLFIGYALDDRSVGLEKSYTAWS
ncbi:MAG: hypothetical protein KAH68_04835 [Draconibacterium sp.]|nr:hypothetical protein [Draconibacterium sp.]